jgi:hypothetical protein
MENGWHSIRINGVWEFGRARRVNFCRVLTLHTVDRYLRDSSLPMFARDDFVNRRKLSFVTAAKLILLVDVRGEEVDFRRKTWSDRRFFRETWQRPKSTPTCRQDAGATK